MAEFTGGNPDEVETGSLREKPCAQTVANLEQQVEGYKEYQWRQFVTLEDTMLDVKEKGCPFFHFNCLG